MPYDSDEPKELDVPVLLLVEELTPSLCEVPFEILLPTEALPLEPKELESVVPELLPEL